MMMSGSCRISVRIPEAKSKSICGLTWVWLKLSSTISMGSSMVETLTSGVASCLSEEYSVVVLPEPVGPVTKIMPWGLRVIFCHRARSSPTKPKSLKLRSSTSGSKIRITSFSPKAVGKVDNRNSTSEPSLRLVLIRPSWGLRFSATFIRDSTFKRLTTAVLMAAGNSYT